jgi:molybdopterin-binding protein
LRLETAFSLNPCRHPLQKTFFFAAQVAAETALVDPGLPRSKVEASISAVWFLPASCEEKSPIRAFHRRIYNVSMPISARNKLRGKIEEIELGDIMAHVVVRVGDNLIESAITRRSADELKLKKGDTVTAVVKATEVMIQKD